MTRTLIVLIAGAVVAVIGLKFSWEISAAGCVVMLVAFALLLRRQVRENADEFAQVTASDAQLRSDLIAAQKLALAKLGSASEETRYQVAELLVEAAKHLGEPETKSGRIYGNSHFLGWNQEGIDLVAGARLLIDAHIAAEASRP